MTFLQWIINNGDVIAAVLLAVHAAAVAIVNLTPTPKDDDIVAKLYKPIEWLAGILTKKAKE